MKFIGFILALALFAGILFLLGYGLFEVWSYLAYQWSLVDASLKPVVIILSSLIIVCAFLVTWFVQSGFKRGINVSQGKNSAYNSFLRWYIEADRHSYASTDIAGLVNMRSEFLLWAGNNVMKQFNNLYNELSAESPDIENIGKYAKHVYIEIQRELGRRASSVLRQI